MFVTKRIFLAAAGLSMAALLAGQEKTQDVLIERDVIHTAPMAAGAGARVFVGTPANVEFLSMEMLPGKVVTGAPYSAEAVTETVQTLADGNRITRKNRTRVARDSDGRTRREQSAMAPGPGAGDESGPDIVFIHDPGAGVHYTLHQQDKTAVKMPSRAPGGTVAFAPAMQARVSSGAVAGPGIEWRRRVEHMKPDDVQTEQLGSQVIEGVRCDGTRTKHVIPAGEIGNERPIEVVFERWFSPELQTMVLTRHSDPRMGEVTFRLTGISRSEPVRSLFEVPADYKIVEAAEGKPFNHEIKVRRPAP